MQIKRKTEYRASFAFVLVSAAALPFFDLLAIMMMFERFGSIQGWTLYEILIPYSVINFGAHAGELFFRGFDRFSFMVREAGFDRLLTRPKPLMLQVMGSDFEINRVGRISISVLLLVYAIYKLQLGMSAAKIFLLALMLASSLIIFGGVYIIRAAACFWTTEGLEIINIVSDGGRHSMQYPLSIYNRAFRFVFTFLIPFGAANFYPLLVLLGRAGENILLYSLAPLMNILFFAACVCFWKFGVSRYASAGS